MCGRRRGIVCIRRLLEVVGAGATIQADDAVEAAPEAAGSAEAEAVGMAIWENVAVSFILVNGMVAVWFGANKIAYFGAYVRHYWRSARVE